MSDKNPDHRNGLCKSGGFSIDKSNDVVLDGNLSPFRCLFNNTYEEIADSVLNFMAILQKNTTKTRPMLSRSIVNGRLAGLSGVEALGQVLVQ